MSEVESLQVPVRDEITNLGVLVTEAENLLSNFFDVDMSGEFKREHVQQCKVKLLALRAEIVALGCANDMIDSKCVYPWNGALHNFWGPFENSVNNADESVTQIIRHHQFFVTLILARPANLALFFAEFQVSLR